MSNQRRVLAMTAGLVVTVGAALFVFNSHPTDAAAPTPTFSSAPKGVTVSITTTPWDSGASAEVAVTNTSGAAINDWKVDLPWQVALTSVWNGVSISTPGHVIVSQESWNGSLAAGATTSFGLTYSTSTSPAAPQVCGATVSEQVVSCEIAAVTSSSVASTPATLVDIPSANGLADYKVAPYIDMAAYPTPDLVAARTSSNQNAFSLGFVTAAADCQPAWGGYSTLAVGAKGGQIGSIDASIARLRTAGADVIVSFGGAAGTELARTCTDVTKLKNAYRTVVDRYSLRAIDLDIEGAAQSDHAANVRRSQALAALQGEMARDGQTLRISLTLPVLPTGLTSTGLGVVQDTIRGNANVELVNVMAMDYGDPNSQMGGAAIKAASSTANQLSALWPTLSESQRITHIGVTPMIGQNDVANEVFTVADAHQLTTWARTNGLGRLSWWQVMRDSPCPGKALVLSTTCSGTKAPAGAYSSEFGKR